MLFGFADRLFDLVYRLLVLLALSSEVKGEGRVASPLGRDDLLLVLFEKPLALVALLLEGGELDWEDRSGQLAQIDLVET